MALSFMVQLKLVFRFPEQQKVGLIWLEIDFIQAFKAL